MNKANFVKPNDPILLQVADPISIEKITSNDTKEIINKMLKIAYGEQIDFTKPLLVGLAAPQVGISKRVILVDVSAKGKGNVGKLKVFINPEITWKSKEENEWYEGCFSTDRVCGIVSRPKLNYRHITTKVKKLRRNMKGILLEFSSTRPII